MLNNDYIDFAGEIVKMAVKKGAHEAEVYIEKGDKFTLEVKDGQVETLHQAGSKGLGLRIFKDKKLSFGYTSDFSIDGMENFIKDLIVIAGYSDEDPCNGLPSFDMKPSAIPDLYLYDEKLANIPTEKKIEIAKRMEEGAKAYDKRIHKFRTSKFNNSEGQSFLVNSNGFSMSKKETHAYIVCIPVAEDDGEKQVGSWYSISRFFDELENPETIGKIAAEKAIKMLGARPVKSSNVPVVFSSEVASSLCKSLGTACGGQMIFRKSSFFTGKIGEKVASEKLTIIDDGLIPKGFGSTPFDGEGIVPVKKILIDKGILSNYLFDTFYGRKMKLKSTGNASRTYSSLPYVSTNNLYIEKGDRTPEEIIKGVDNGFYVTSTMGSGLDYSSGDYSVGAEGFWIEKGQLSYPVSQVTISGSILDILKNITDVGNDLYMRDDTFAPTVKISSMTVGGK